MAWINDRDVFWDELEEVERLGIFSSFCVKMNNNRRILKYRNDYKYNKKRYKMGFGEYASLLLFGIFTTEIVKQMPEQLPLLLLGGFVISLFLMKLFNWVYFKIEDSKINYVVWGIIGGITASVGIIIASQNILFFQIKGLLWIALGVVVMKFNIDGILK